MRDSVGISIKMVSNKLSPKEPFSGKSPNAQSNKITHLPVSKREIPNTVNGNVPPVRKPNKVTRSREYLTDKEVTALMDAARKTGRHGHRDAAMILLAYRHGLRVSELVSLRWDQINLGEGMIHINRVKNGSSSTHPLRGKEIRALRRLYRDYPETQYVFITERKGPITTSTVRKMIARAGVNAKLSFPVHPHMLRHACGYKLANDGQDTRAIQHYMGHKNIQHTVTYTEMAPDRFNGFWKD